MIQKESKEASSETQKEIDRLQGLLQTKNSYFDSFKNEMALTKQASEKWNKD